MNYVPSIRRIAIAVLVITCSIRSSAQLTANFNADVKSGCAPLIVNFSDGSSGSPTQWIWTLGNGATSSIQNPTTTYFIPGTYQVKLAVKNITGTDSITKNQFITVYANPSISFKTSDSTGCFPKTVQFTDHSLPGSGTISGWTWDLGDGTLSNQQNPIHTYNNQGMYDVTLRIVNNFGCQKTITRSDIIILQNPSADFVYTANTSCAITSTVQFTDMSSGTIMRQWQFGDGNTSTLANPVHTFAATGTYNVKLVVTGSSGCTDSMVKTVVVGASVADFSYSTLCQGDQVTFQNTSSPSPVSARWNFGDGTTSTLINPVKKYDAAGNFQVQLISEFGGCADTIVKLVTVHKKPVATFSQAGNLLTCAPGSAINFTTPPGNAAYLWFFGDGTTSTLQNPSHSYSAYGNYDVTLITKNSFGCADTIRKNSLVQIAAPEITSIKGGFEGCAPYSASFTPTISSIDTVVGWFWDLGDGTTSTLPHPTHTYTSPGTYHVKLKIITAGGCTDSFTYINAIRISNKPVASFTATPLVTCAAGPVQFNNSSTGANSYFWIFNDGGFSTEPDPAHQFGDTGVFTITLIATSTGCSDTLTIPKYVRNDPPIGRFSTRRDCNKPYEIQFRDSSIGGQTYLWKFGDGDTSTLRYPVHIYQSTGIYNIEFTVFHGSCSYTSTGSVTIIDEHPQLSISDNAICRNDIVGINAANVNPSNIANYHWSFGDGDKSSIPVSNVDHRYGSNGKYFPALVTEDILGCLDTASNIVELNVYGPKAGFKNLAGICIGSTATFVDTSVTDGLHAITNWSWNFGDGTAQQFLSPAFSHTYNTKGTFNVQLKVRDNYGCEDSVITISAIAVTDPVAGFITSDSIKCSGNTVSFNNTSDGLALQYAWNFGDNNTSTEIQPQHAYAKEGSYDVQLMVTDLFGCKSSVSKKQVISNTIAKFIASDTFASCPPLLVNLTNKASSYTNISWDFGDGSNAGLQNPSHYYTYPGTYQLVLKTQGHGSCIDSAVQTIVVKGPTGAFTISPLAVCTNSPVKFSASTNGKSHFLWDFSDGNAQQTNDSSVSHSYETPGYYQPRMILIDTAGCQVPITSPDTIKVLGVQARIDFNNTIFCDYAAVQFRDSSLVHNDLPAQYQWQFGDGATSNLSNPSHYYSKPGVFTTKLVITTQAGCIDSVSSPSPISIARSPKIGITSGSSVCLKDTIDFSGVVIQPDTSPLQWSWHFGNGRTSTLQNPNQAFDNDGVFKVVAVAKNNSGCSDTVSRDILVHPLPNVNAGTDTMICRGQTYSLQPTGAASYEWQNDVTLNCTSCSSAVAKPVFNNVYYVTGTSQFGCKATDSLKIEVQQPFSMNVSRDDSVCKGSAVQLKANGAAVYSWYPATGLNNAGIANPVATPSVTTNYLVIGSDAKKCFRDTGYVKLRVFPVPQFSILEDKLTLPAGTERKISTTSSEDITRWKWYPAKGLSCTDCPEPVVSVKDNIMYRAEVSNEGGCTAREDVTISVICNDGNVFIPNTFSPNNDGMNDVFYPRGKGITSIKNMKVFNRWGELVFEKSDFSANDATAGWNGSFKGSKLTPDVYVYIVDVVCYNSTVFTLKGNVSLIR